jgi:hypothetical protein
MTASITVIGLVAETHYIEDIRVQVPYRMAVVVPAPLAFRSRDLQTALQQRRVMQLGNVLPAGSVYRGTGAVPGASNPNPLPVPAEEPAQWKAERESLLRELESSRAQTVQLRTMNEALQSLLTTMSGQLTGIQRVLETLKLQGVLVPTPERVTEVAPMFIPDNIRTEASEVSITVPESKVDTDLSGARGALRALRTRP